MEDLFELLSKFVIIAGTIDYGGKFLRWLIKKLDKLQKPRRHKRK